jgi:excisionase family DNA binding protein
MSPDAPSEEREFLTVQQLAARLQVHEKTIRRWIVEDSSMPVTRLGPGTVRFHAGRIERWLRQRESGLAAPRTHRHVRSLPNRASRQEAAGD